MNHQRLVSALAISLGALAFSAGTLAQSGSTGGASSGASGGGGTSMGSGGSGMGANSGAMSGQQGAQLARADRRMLNDIVQANIAEIETGQIALEKSQNPEVRRYAQTMIDDHTTALRDVQQFAQARGIDIPKETDLKHKAVATTLKAMVGETFDKQYMSQAGVADHKRTHELLQKTQRNAKDPELKALAEKMMPVVHGHLETAQQQQQKQAQR